MNLSDTIQKALSLHQEGHIEEAEALYEILLEKIDPSVDLLYLAALAAWMLGKSVLAKERLQKAILLDPNDARLYNLQGNVLQRTQEYEQATIAYQRALELDPNNATTWSNLGVAHHELGHFDIALRHHQEALARDGEDMSAHYNHGRTLLSLQRYTEAETALRKAYDQAPRDSDILNNLGNALLHQMKIVEARRFYAQALAENARNVDALYNMATSYKMLGEYEEAKTRYQALLGLAPQHFSSITALAEIAILAQDFYQAEQLYQIALQIQPKHGDCLAGLGMALLRQQHIDDAIDTLTEAVRIQPKAETWISLGLAHRERAQESPASDSRQAAAAALEKAVALDPENGKAIYLLHVFQGTLPERAPLDYVRNLFDYYAPKFDEHLRDVLHYQTPQKLSQFLRRHHTQSHFERVLDLGCGTGLMAEELRDLSQRIIGVDLSEKMLAQAEKKEVYHSLFNGDILSYLGEERPAFDLIVAADVLVYFGDLQPILSAVSQRLKPGGVFLFSVEKQDTGFSLTL
ncbi:MAG: tetratricopeptide repeat protein, partial [Myxococcota bacterium]|nr:tetratricopeptide repeat protein [Myxococcota bacterium]